MPFLTQKITSPKSFLKKVVLLSFLLNGLVVALSLLYHSGMTQFLFGVLVSAVFLLVFFYDLGLMAVNNAFLDKQASGGKLLNRLTYLYLVYTFLAALLVAGQGFLGIGVAALVLFYGIWVLALVITFLDHRYLNAESEGAFKW